MENNQNYKEIQDMTRDELENLQKNVIRKAEYKKPRGRPKVNKKAEPNDRLKCEICGKEYNRSGRTCHERTVFHKEKEKINKKLRDILL